jgi:hypothetical protein
LAQPLRKLWREHARDDIDRPAGRERRDHLHRSIGIVRWLRQARAGDEKRGKPKQDRLHSGGLFVREGLPGLVSGSLGANGATATPNAQSALMFAS